MVLKSKYKKMHRHFLFLHIFHNTAVLYTSDTANLLIRVNLSGSLHVKRDILSDLNKCLTF